VRLSKVGLSFLSQEHQIHTDSSSIYVFLFSKIFSALQIAWMMGMTMRGLSIIRALERTVQCVQIVSTEPMNKRRKLHRRVWVSESTFGTGQK
jgi:hypothetical protein